MKHCTILLFCFLSISGLAQETWLELNSPSERDLECVHFIDPTTCCIGGDSVLLKTVDSGLNFEILDLSGIDPLNNQSYVISDMHWDNEDAGWIVLTNWGGLYKTTDGGETWSLDSPANAGFCQFKSIEKSPNGKLFLGGAGCFTGSLIDYFENGLWQSATLPENWDTSDIVNTINFYTEDLGLAGTSTGKILRSTDGGLNWSYIEQDVVENINITDFAFANQDKFVLCYASENISFGFLESTDQGETWASDLDLNTFFYPNIHGAYLSDIGTSYFVGSFGNLEEEQGYITSYPATQNLTVNEVLKDVHGMGNTVFAVGHNGSIYSRPPIVNLEENDFEADVLNSYPNPNEGVLHLSFTRSNWKEYSIVNTLGEVCLKGTFKEDFSSNGTLDLGFLPAGAYFLNLMGNDSQESTRFIVK